MMTILTTKDIRKLCGNMPPPGTLRDDDPPEFQERSQAQQANHEAIVATIMGQYADKAVSLSARPLALGESIEFDALVDKMLPGKWVGQNSGSCVGTNWFNQLLCQILVESFIKKTGEKLDGDYFWGPTYGWGRYYGGMTDEGEGSYLSVQHQASVKKGIPRMDASPDFPKYEDRDGARWIPARVEKWWASQPNYGKKYDDLSDDHLVLDGAMLPTGRDWQDGMQQILAALDTGPLGLASMLGSSGVYEKNGVKLSDWSDRWAHNMGLCGKQNHPKLGMIFKILNRSWLPSDYSWFWITEKTLISVLKDSGTEVAAIRDFNGIRESGVDIEWLINLIMTLTAG